MGYYSDYEGTVSLDGHLPKEEVVRIAEEIFGPECVEDVPVGDTHGTGYYSGAAVRDAYTVEFYAYGWKWYDFEKEFSRFADALAERGCYGEGEVEVHGEEHGDIWKMVLDKDGARRVNARISWDE